MKKTYAIINYGCQMNESDSEHYAGQLLDLGYEASADYEHADVVVINTCCVRENAEKKILGKIGEMKRLKRENPDMVLCVAGCMARNGARTSKKNILKWTLSWNGSCKQFQFHPAKSPCWSWPR